MAESDTLSTDQLSVSPGYQHYSDTSKGALDSLMEKLRCKVSKDAKHYKSWGEMTKALRIAITDKRNIIDNVERSNLQKVLDTLQKSIKVTSLQSMVERLDSITRQQGLKLVRQSNTQCYISSDMFYVEILLEHSGDVNDVKIAHGEPVSCPELTKVLRSGNFSEFTKHLEGLSAIYQWNADSSGQLDYEAQKKLKKEAFSSLRHLEYDLSQIWQRQQNIVKNLNKLVHESPVGILQERRGGYFLKLTYFISPYDLLDIKTKSSITLTVNAVAERGLGHSVTVCIGTSNTHRLQKVSLINWPENGEKNNPSFAALSPFNSTALPASFILKLQKPIPIAVNILKKIQGVTKISIFADLCNAQSLLSVIICDTSKGKIPNANHKNLFVTLPDQHHCYNMKTNADLQGVLVSSIPFTHPTHVPQILKFLKQQMLFNTVISSCVRPRSKRDVDSALKFDIHSYSTNHIQVTFVHPLDESLAAVDLDLKEISCVKCKIHTLGMDDSLCTDEYASKIMQRCLSIPVTMRAVIRKAQGQQQQKRPDRSDMSSATVGGRNDGSYIPHMSSYSNSLSNGSSLSSGPFTNLASGMCNKAIDGPDLNNLSNMNSENMTYSMHGNDSCKLEQSAELGGQLEVPSVSKVADGQADKNVYDSKSPALTPSLPSHQSKPANAMLLNMLNDVPSATPSSNPFSLSSSSSSSRKRKATGDAKSPGSVGRSAKRKMSEDEAMREHLSSEPLPSDSPSFNSDQCNSLPATFLSASADAVRAPLSVDPYVKSEPQSHSYPQRSASTDSYLTFRPHHVLNSSEGGSPDLPNMVSQSNSLSQFTADRERHISGGPVSLDDSSLCLVTNQGLSEKLLSEKVSKKVRKNKEAMDSKLDVHDVLVIKSHDLDSSEGSSSSDFFLKSGGDAGSRQMEEATSGTKSSHFVHSSQPNISTSLKISKSGDGHKVSKSESKIKQKDRRSTSEGKRKGEGKKERKRRQVQSADSTSDRMSNQPSHSDSSLMPPPTSSGEMMLSVSVCDMQPKRPVMLNVKDSPPSGSSQSKPQVSIGSGAISAGSSSKSSLSKSSSDKTAMKSSRSSHSTISSKNSEHDGDVPSVTKVMLNTSSKLQSKPKQSSSSKGASGSHSGNQSPNKPKSTSLKLKNTSLTHLHLPSQMNPGVSKSHLLSSSTSISASPASEDQQMSPTGKQTCSSSKSHKSQFRSGKRALNAVIDKLRVSATHAQSPESFKPNSCGGRSELSSERMELKQERKESTKDSKDGSVSKGTESKNKKYSDQFTVKQSSQGIKLTVTKTKSSDGSSKHGKSKPASSKSLSSGGVTNPNKNRTSGTHIAKKTSSLSSSTKKAVHTTTNTNLQTSTSPKIVSSVSSSNPTKSVACTGSKVSSSSNTTYQKVSTSVGSILKSPKSSSSSSLSQVKKKTSSESKSHPENLEKSSTSGNLPVKLTVSTPSKMTRMDSNWQLSNSTSHSEEEADRERTFRILLEQSENEGQNGSEQNLPSAKPADFSIKSISATKNEIEDKEFSVSSSTDIKRSCNPLRVNQDYTPVLDQNVPRVAEMKPVIHQEISSKKQDVTVNANSLVSSSEEINKALTSFAKVVKNECLNAHNEDDSSPDGGLIIDYPGTPRMADQKRSTLSKKEKSPDQKRNRLETGLAVEDRANKFEYSQVTFIAKTPDQRSPSTSNHARSLPHEPWPIDDDLMNMALTIGK